MGETIEGQLAKSEASLQMQAPEKKALTPPDMLQMMVEKGIDNPDSLEKMMAMQERWEANEAKKAFMKAKAEFNRNPPKVIKDKINNQYGSMYVSAENLINTVREALSEHGLSISFDYSTDPTTREITVTCILSHELGHSEKVSLSGPPDESGKKNSLQQIKSTTTYLKIATFEGVTGIASEYANLNDDGNGSGNPEPSSSPDEPGEKKLPAYPEEDFKKNINAWSKAVSAGKTTPQKIIAKVSTKGTLTDQQKQNILELG